MYLDSMTGLKRSGKFTSIEQAKNNSSATTKKNKPKTSFFLLHTPPYFRSLTLPFDFSVTGHPTGSSWRNSWQQTNQSVIWSCCNCSGSSVEGFNGTDIQVVSQEASTHQSLCFELLTPSSHAGWRLLMSGPCLKHRWPRCPRDASAMALWLGCAPRSSKNT